MKKKYKFWGKRLGALKIYIMYLLRLSMKDLFDYILYIVLLFIVCYFTFHVIFY